MGETERQIRLVFQRAREKSEEGWPVIVFFDEMDSMFRTRGTGISSDIESTIVPQLLAEIDGVESLRNVIVIGASNREDLIDPAILRPGSPRREDQDRAAQRDGGRADLRPLPDGRPADRRRRGARHSVAATRRSACRASSSAPSTRCTAPTRSNQFLEVTYQNGDKEIMYFKDFASGAMIENIVRRAKKLAIKRVIADGPQGHPHSDLVESIHQEYKEHEDLPNTTNPDDWAKISGKKGERIVYVRTIIRPRRRTRPTGGRSIERVATGQYL